VESVHRARRGQLPAAEPAVADEEDEEPEVEPDVEPDVEDEAESDVPDEDESAVFVDDSFEPDPSLLGDEEDASAERLSVR
jgi:hypothetical protein